MRSTLGYVQGGGRGVLWMVLAGIGHRQFTSWARGWAHPFRCRWLPALAFATREAKWTRNSLARRLVPRRPGRSVPCRARQTSWLCHSIAAAVLGPGWRAQGCAACWRPRHQHGRYCSARRLLWHEHPRSHRTVKVQVDGGTRTCAAVEVCGEGGREWQRLLACVRACVLASACVVGGAACTTSR